MKPKEVEGEMFSSRAAPVQLVQSCLCVNCYPIQKPAFFMWYGLSLCQGCFEPRRKSVDAGKAEENATPGVDRRDYKRTWGSEPVEDAEVI